MFSVLQETLGLSALGLTVGDKGYLCAYWPSGEY